MKPVLKTRLGWRLWGAVLLAGTCLAAPARAQSTGTLRGTVTLESTGDVLHKARVLLPQLGRSVETAEDGTYLFENVPAGTYTVVVQATALAEERATVGVSAGATATLDFQLHLSTLRQQITVTASGREQTSFETFQSVLAVDSIQMIERSQSSLGEALEGEPGVAKRSFGPGSARPVLRGFDGDRVLILKDGIRTGTLSSQSGDHGESMDLVGLDRLEVVKGPATLLYGSNAVGGVVNVVTPQEHLFEHATQGLRGYATGFGGAANAYGGGGAGFEYVHKKWALWGSGSGQRTGDYHTPLGEVFNSRSRSANANAGAGWFNGKAFWGLSYAYENARFGVPFAALFEEGAGGLQTVSLPAEEPQVLGASDERIEIPTRRHNARLSGGMRELHGWIESFRVSLDLSNYRHREEEIDDATGAAAVGTVFDNRQFVYQAKFQQKKTGPLSGQFGLWGMHRNYDTAGAEALAPPVNQNNFAVFALEELDFERVRFQFGGRVEHTAYRLQAGAAGRPDRDFTGFSGAAGMHLPTWKGGAFVVNYTHSYRAPALEELYNNGPHVGSLTFEIGSAQLRSERTNGVDFSLRHQARGIRGEVNFFTYGISDFVFLAPTGNLEDGLIEAEFLQADSRFVGAEANLALALHRDLWLNLGLDYVNAELSSSVTTQSTGLVTADGTPLPRIPPLRGRVGFEWRWNGLSVRPEVVMVSDQERLFSTETRTAGYTLVNLAASYTRPQKHFIHVFSINAFNLGDRLYRNHLSFIKDLAPEIGRGVRFGYTVRFF